METDFQEGFEVVGEDGWVEFLDSGAVKLDDVFDSAKFNRYESFADLGGGCHQGCGGKSLHRMEKGSVQEIGGG